jgi:hypothetical protein
MSRIYKLLKEESGVATIEATLCISIIMFLFFFIYETLKFQTDIAMITYNEQIAIHRMDVSMLNTRYTELRSQFAGQLEQDNASNYFSTLAYTDVRIHCYNNLDLKQTTSCGRYDKIVNFTYTVTRKYTNPVFTSLLSLPVDIKREVFLINDYYN